MKLLSIDCHRGHGPERAYRPGRDRLDVLIVRHPALGGGHGAGYPTTAGELRSRLNLGTMDADWVQTLVAPNLALTDARRDGPHPDHLVVPKTPIALWLLTAGHDQPPFCRNISP
jgi:hypothetical protein